MSEYDTLYRDIKNPADAISAIQKALATPHGAKTLLLIKGLLWQKILFHGETFPVTGSLRLFVEFYRVWRAFVHCGFAFEDMVDVAERAREFTSKILAHPLPAHLQVPPDPAVDDDLIAEEFLKELEKIPGFLEFRDFAFKRFDEIISLPAYKSLNRDNPEAT